MSDNPQSRLQELTKRIQARSKSPQRVELNCKNTSFFITGLEQTIEHDRLVWQTAFDKDDKHFDGVVLRTLFFLLRPALWLHQFVYLSIVSRTSKDFINRICCRSDDDLNASNEKGEDPLLYGLRMRWRSNDWYLIWWSILISISYTVVFLIVWLQSENYSWHWSFLIALLAAIAFLRIYEIFSFLTVLHTTREYYTQSPPRAMVNTLYHYIELTIGFAVLHLASAWFSCDTFQTNTSMQCQPIFGSQCDIIDPVYFSFVTITTLGYGDYSPQKWPGKVLVCAQVFFGIFVLVIVIQRVLSAPPSPSSDHPEDALDAHT